MRRARHCGFAVRRMLVILVALCPAANVAAQEPLTLEAAVHAALTRNASLHAARAGVDEAAARASEARAGFFPRIAFTETWQRGDQPVFVFSSLLSSRRFTAANFAIDALNHSDAVGFMRTSIGIDQVIFDGGRQHAVDAAAALQHDVAIATADEAAAGIAVATTQTFAHIVTAEAARRAADAGLIAAREDLARAERRRDSGMATDADVLALVVYVADLQQRTIEAAGEAAAARAELNRLMGDPISADVRVVEPSIAPREEFGDRTRVTVLLAEAESARPELKRAIAAQRAADATRRQARAALLPQITTQAALEAGGTRFSDRASSWIVGGELRWSFSTGGAELAARRAAAAAIGRAAAQIEDTRAALHVDVVSALARFDTAAAREAAGRAAVDQARESQRIIRDRFEAGIASVNDVLRASTAVLDAERNSISALVESVVARAVLRRALGRTP